MCGDEKMQLSKRLETVAGMVTQGSRVADIGCDHAYVTIYLLKNLISPYVVAMDINQGPLDRALENTRKYGVEDKVSIRKSDGLEKLQVGEVDTILIAGMGGRLVTQILASRMDVVCAAKELVLQPQSDIYFVRENLKEWGFKIVEENMLKEDGKYYVMMKVKTDPSYGDDKRLQLTKPEHIHFGRLLLEEKNPVLLEQLQTEKHLYKNIYEELVSHPTRQSIQRQAEINELIRLIDQAIGYYKEEK